MKALLIFLKDHPRLIKSIIKTIVIAIAVAILACIGLWAYHYYVARQQDNFAAKVENVKTMVRHNALQIEDEAIFADTINGISEIYSVKARITVQYDLENMRYQFEGDTLVVELPREIIQATELDRRLLDEYYIDGKFHVSRPTITGKQTNEIEHRMKQFITSTMINQEHIKRARRNELANIIRLFSAIHHNVRVVMNISEPHQAITPETLPLPLDR